MISYLKNSLRKISQKILFRILPNLRALEEGSFNFDMINEKQIFSNISKKAKVHNPYRLVKSKIGDYTYVSLNSNIVNTTIGRFSSIGPNFISGWGIHPINGISTNPMFYSTRKQNGITLSKSNKIDEVPPVSIGNDVFIGANVIVLNGVTIADGAVIGAGSVVSKNIPAYAIAVGAPIKVIKYRFDDEIITKLLKVKWWDKDMNHLNKIEQHFFDVEKYLGEVIETPPKSQF